MGEKTVKYEYEIVDILVKGTRRKNIDREEFKKILDEYAGKGYRLKETVYCGQRGGILIFEKITE